MGSYYELKIQCDRHRRSLIENVISKSSRDFETNWSLIIEEDSPLFTNALFQLVKLIQQNKEELNSIGINGADISFWFMYEYEQQCNMEFEPSILKGIGDLEATFCISCWEK